MHRICDDQKFNKYLYLYLNCYRTYSLSGAYRKAFVKPTELNWHLVRYNTEEDTLIRSDVEELRGENQALDIDGGKQKALIIAFNLPSSCYATMALREILKCDTSVACQVQLQQETALPESSTNDAENEIESGIESKQPKLDELC